MEIINLSCPDCRTKYVADKNEIQSVSTARPEFDCVTCGVRFYFDYDPSLDFSEAEKVAPALELAEAVSPVPQSEVSLEAGPAEKNHEQVETSKVVQSITAGVDAKVLERLKEPMRAPSTPYLRTLWEEVVQDYENRALHRRFVDAAYDARKLPYAAEQYRVMLDVMGTDEIARDMTARIEQLVTQSLNRVTSKAPESPDRAGIFYLLLFISILLMSTGLLVSGVRQLIGAGASVLVIAFGYRYLVKSR